MWLRLKSFSPQDFPIGTVVIAHDKHRLYPAIVVRHTAQNLMILSSDDSWGVGRKDPDRCVPAKPESLLSLPQLDQLLKWYNKENKVNIQISFL